MKNDILPCLQHELCLTDSRHSSIYIGIMCHIEEDSLELLTRALLGILVNNFVQTTIIKGLHELLLPHEDHKQLYEVNFINIAQFKGQAVLLRNSSCPVVSNAFPHHMGIAFLAVGKDMNQLMDQNGAEIIGLISLGARKDQYLMFHIVIYHIRGSGNLLIVIQRYQSIRSVYLHTVQLFPV